MERTSQEFFENLLSTPSPSGAEEAAVRLWASYARPFADRIEKDVHGNVMAVLNPEGAPRVMLAGHIDEIGFMVSHISKEGYVSFAQIGGHDLQIIQGMRVKVLSAKGPVTGLIGKKPIHLLKAEERKKVPETEDLWIDIGAKNVREAKRIVEVGDAIVIDVKYENLRNGFAVARGFDDRAGAFVVVEALRLLSKSRPKAAVYAVATVQEEVGLRGAKTSAFGIDPQVGIAVDVTHAMDYPGVGRERASFGDLSLGKGPVLSRGPNINPKVFARLQAAAKKRRIAFQVEAAPGGTGTDANAIQVSRAGVATGLVSIPNRYMHTPCEMVCLKDVENAAKLLAAFVEGLDGKSAFIPSEG
ncbi:MAG: M42 family metallopeptidase [Planctomycetota bacterium]